ncbi:unannotated protein [freshwater metagenome]|uniref:Unannotated protein n=1 Tax=freshwater metagenome TaxID=449393 RepID=A0A6J5YEF5_9ZZZZ
MTATLGVAVAIDCAGVDTVTGEIESPVSVGSISQEVRLGVTRFGGVALSSIEPLKPAVNLVSSRVMTRSVPTTVGPEVMRPANPEVAVYFHDESVIDGVVEVSSGMVMVVFGPHWAPPVPWQDTLMA